MKPSTVAEFAAALAAGAITTDAISDQMGDSFLTDVLSFGAGIGVASIVPTVMRETGISDLVDDLFDW